MKISEIKLNPNNPRVIKDDRFKKLVKSIVEFPKMMELRPMVINKDNIVLGGNMRLKALKELGYKEIPDSWVKRADELTEEEQRRFIIADNVGFGEHDWEMLANEWDVEELGEWGLDIPEFDNIQDESFELENNENDLFDIELPFYTPSELMPKIEELAEYEKTKILIEKIEMLKINEELKYILKNRACFFTNFNFQKIADYYYNSNEDIKEIFEELGMIIVAPKRAVELGFVNLKENIEQ